VVPLEEPIQSQASARPMGPALESFYRFLLWLMPTVEKFPRSQKFVLGDRIQVTALNALDGLMEATYTRQRRALLGRVNLDLEKLRMLFRLAFDLRLLDARRYEHAARCLDETGRLVGGWRRRCDDPAS